LPRSSSTCRSGIAKGLLVDRVCAAHDPRGNRSYLGLKLETVSRLFSRFRQEGLIQVQGRSVKLLDITALKQLLGQRC
jgi:Crp-like helix-turn-helix domain